MKPCQLAVAKTMKRGNLNDYNLGNGGTSERNEETAGGMERRGQNGRAGVMEPARGSKWLDVGGGPHLCFS